MVWSLKEKGCGKQGVSMQKYGSCRKFWKRQTEKRWNEVVKDDLKNCGLDNGLAKDRERWQAKIMGKISNLCEHG